VLVVAWVVASEVFTVASRDGGMFTPESAPDLGVISLGLVAIVLRLLALFVAGPVLVYRALAYRPTSTRTGPATSARR
jgi:hypothetical protein